jgi:hypothetical protein
VPWPHSCARPSAATMKQPPRVEGRARGRPWRNLELRRRLGSQARAER